MTTADCYNVHFEKAYGEIQGAYAVINREMARWVRVHPSPEVAYFNREDDMGLGGPAEGEAVLLSGYPAGEIQRQRGMSRRKERPLPPFSAGATGGMSLITVIDHYIFRTIQYKNNGYLLWQKSVRYNEAAGAKSL